MALQKGKELAEVSFLAIIFFHFGLGGGHSLQNVLH